MSKRYEYGSAPVGSNKPIQTASEPDAWPPDWFTNGRDRHLVRRQVGEWEPAQSPNL